VGGSEFCVRVYMHIICIHTCTYVFRIHGWMEGRNDGCMDGWMDRRMDGRTEGWMDRRMDGWMHACTRCMYVSIYIHILLLLYHIKSNINGPFSIAM
jgi:hypothetical protein